jgi:hypothetical protein
MKIVVEVRTARHGSVKWEIGHEEWDKDHRKAFLNILAVVAKSLAVKKISAPEGAGKRERYPENPKGEKP